MHYRPLGSTGIPVSTISFGAGPVADLMTAPDRAEDQLRTVARAIELGVNWCDTAATYGEGRSELALGRALRELNAAGQVHVATKVRVPAERLDRIGEYVRESFAGSLQRLQLPRVTLLQVHNSITPRRGDLATSITPTDVLGTGGMLEAFEELRREGLVQHFGLTALGDPASLAEVLRSGQFAAVQIPYNLLNPSAGRVMPHDFAETNLGNLLELCQSLGIGAMAIRVFAGGALAGQPPSRHTLTTKFFPLDLYQRDLARAAALASTNPIAETAVRYVLSHGAITSALIGCGSPQEVDAAVAAAENGLLSEAEVQTLQAVASF